MRTIHRILILITVWALVPAGLRAQNNYFSVVNGLPHLPVFANTAAVTSPLPGAMVYSTADATVMVYSGDTWDSFCTQQLALTTGAFTQFTVQGGIPYLPVKSTTAVTSTTGTAGTLYYPSNQSGLRINNSVNWFTPATLTAAPVTTTYTTAGNLTGLAGGLAIPVMAANPAFVASDKGAIYLNSADFKLHVNNGTAWVAIDCSTCPGIADGVTVNVDDPVNMTTITGGYSYFQKTNIAEATSLSLFRWRVANDASGNGATLDPTTTATYTPGYSDGLNGKYLQFEVRPKATGLLLGAAVTSPWTLIKNCPPQVNAVLINGDFDNLSSNSFSLGGYSYFDAEGNPEAATGQTYRWFLSTGANGTGTTTALSTDVAYAYTYTETDDGKYLNLGVTSKATKGYSTSDESLASGLLKNCPPQANAALLTPVDTSYSVPVQLPLSYSYYDKEGNLEGASVLTYYRADDAAGTTNRTQLATGTSVYTYTFADADRGKYLLATVLPKAASGFSTGTPITSPTVKIWNCAPQASGVLVESSNPSFSGATTIGVSYSYFDKEGNPEGASDVKLYMATSASGSGAVQLASGASLSYTYTDADEGKYLYATVTPKATAGYSTGDLVSGATLVHNCQPQVTGVLINGTLTVGQALTAGYAYYDSEGNAEGASTYQWYRATDAAGTGKTPISGATAATYTLVAGDSGKFIGLGVTPRAATGNSTGSELITYTTTAIP